MHQFIKATFWKHWLISFALVLGIGVIMVRHKEICVKELMDIEFAPTAAAFFEMVTQYRNGNANLYNNCMIDFLYMLAYGSLFYYSARILCQLMEIGRSGWALVFLLPTLLDMTENMLMLQMIPEQPSDYFSFSLFYWIVRLKWAAVIPCIAMAIVVLKYQIFVGIDRFYCFLWERKSG